MVLTSVPLTPRVRWWTRLARWPRWLWSSSQEATVVVTELFKRQPSKWKFALIRTAMLICMTLMSPVVLVMRSRVRGPNAFAVLDARVRQIWPTSTVEAVALLWSTFDELVARGAFGLPKRIEIAPFGKFEPWDSLAVEQFLYECEVVLGHYEEALAVATAMPVRAGVIIL